jgi:hypothetical protein
LEPIRELRRLLGIQQRWDALRGASKIYADKQYAKGVELLSAALARFLDDAIVLLAAGYALLDTPLALITFVTLGVVDSSMTSPAPTEAPVQRRGFHEHRPI